MPDSVPALRALVRNLRLWQTTVSDAPRSPLRVDPETAARVGACPATIRAHGVNGPTLRTTAAGLK